MSLHDRQTALIADLNLIEDPHERLAALSSFIPRVALPEAEQSEANRVHGCVSRVWVTGRVRDGRLQLHAAADSPMVAGLVALLCHLYTDSRPAEAAAVEPELWQACGFTKLLSPTRLNGLAAVRARIRELARAASPADG